LRGWFDVPVLRGFGAGRRRFFVCDAGLAYRRFGVQLTFMPTVLKNGLINLRLMPEVSELDFMIGITIAGTTVPGFTTRKAQTTIELRDGKCFAFAGTLQTTGSVQCRCSGRCSAASRSKTRILSRQPLPASGWRLRQINCCRPTMLTFSGRWKPRLGQMEAKKKYTDYVTSGGQVQGTYDHIVGANSCS
jgi:pilus assembly protein CpaC